MKFKPNPQFLRKKIRSFSLPRSRLTSALGSAVLFSCMTVNADTAIYDFSSLLNGSTYRVGDVINTADGTVELRRFQLSNGSWTANGGATVSLTTNAAGSASQELNLNNIMVRVTPNIPAIGASFLYADFGGNVNLGVNGVHRNVNDLIDLNGAVVGGCIVNVSQVAIAGGHRGAVTIVPQPGTTISRFGVGGQEFYIDDVHHDW